MEPPQPAPIPPDSARRFFERKSESVGCARSFAEEVLAHWKVTHRTDDLRLCASELATNALLHGTPRGRGFLLELTLDNGAVTLEVHDSSPAPPAVDHPADDDVHGRGLLLVEALADRWGTSRRQPFGKVVWAVFDLDARDRLGDLRESGGFDGHGTLDAHGALGVRGAESPAPARRPSHPLR
ncbi:ATP-binding protein [Streptomyces sp. H27-D2]|uniref:ATP-binding protein n=1 Tax=Streptomyces sp. H27-D2 TaxID=3046304 RepID=UPI002DBB6D10|nr:ATP-binding protein [Streptomyces sp. H27-D2]MEC4016967.1 ATP-binding protein [Streptomyces sp. H27-D2]